MIEFTKYYYVCSGVSRLFIEVHPKIQHKYDILKADGCLFTIDCYSEDQWRIEISNCTYDWEEYDLVTRITDSLVDPREILTEVINEAHRELMRAMGPRD